MNLLLGYVRDDTTVAEVCGRSFDGLTESVEDLDIMTDLLLRTGNDFKKLVDCSVLVPLYTKTGTFADRHTADESAACPLTLFVFSV